MKSFLLFTFFFTITIAGHTQYVSGKMIPQKGKTVNRDLKDNSFLLSTTITAQEMKEHLSTLASDDFQGRETGQPGNTLAAEYISKELKKLKLPAIGQDNSYFQKVAFTFSSWEKNEVTINGKKFRQLWDFLGFPHTSVSKSIEVDSIIFAGYGIIEGEKINDYKNVNVKNKVVMVWDGEPTDSKDRSIITGQGERSDWTTDYNKKRLIAEQQGASLLLIISNNIKAELDANRTLLINRVTQLGDHTTQTDEDSRHTNMLLISSTMAEEILGDNRDIIIAQRDAQRINGQALSAVQLSSDITVNQSVKKDLLSGQNVLGFIEGTDKKDELVIVSAHYDHIGMKGSAVYNGADDNGSGSTTVLEIAEALAVAKIMKKGPRRSVLCLWMTGEEKGLLGSEYYAENPIFPIENTMVDVNIDMVGRWGEEYLDQSTPYIYVIGSDRLSNDLHAINESSNSTYSGMILDYKYNDEKDPNRFYYRSDHYNFAKKGIPAIFYFNGVHEDYHRASDTIEKIDFDLMAERGRLIFHTIWNLANRENRIDRK
jgi:hypothetical protein